MAAWRYRFECYVQELQAGPTEESNALDQLGITAADFWMLSAVLGNATRLLAVMQRQCGPSIAT